jgi:hypothetical protein
MVLGQLDFQIAEKNCASTKNITKFNPIKNVDPSVEAEKCTTIL